MRDPRRLSGLIALVPGLLVALALVALLPNPSPPAPNTRPGRQIVLVAPGSTAAAGDADQDVAAGTESSAPVESAGSGGATATSDGSEPARSGA
jgi:hypothetical protein